MPSGVVDAAIIQRISENLSTNWKHVARRLDLTDPEIQCLHLELEREGLAEIVHEMLRKWSVQNGSKATYKRSAKALTDARMPEVASSHVKIC